MRTQDENNSVIFSVMIMKKLLDLSCDFMMK